MAAAIEKVGLHTRIALKVLNTVKRWRMVEGRSVMLVPQVGTTPDRILGGFMLVCWALSMWVRAALAMCSSS